LEFGGSAVTWRRSISIRSRAASKISLPRMTSSSPPEQAMPDLAEIDDRSALIG
jgi:hypothetical protein